MKWTIGGTSPPCPGALKGNRGVPSRPLNPLGGPHPRKISWFGARLGVYALHHALADRVIQRTWRAAARCGGILAKADEPARPQARVN